jgi:hypothetical protein
LVSRAEKIGRVTSISCDGVIDSRAPEHAPSALRTAAFGRGNHTNLQYGIAIRFRIVHPDSGSAVVVLAGELDVTSIVQFEQVLDELMAGNPKRITFDLTDVQFICVQGYDAIGRCSSKAAVEVRTRSDIAPRVLAMCGHERVTVVGGLELVAEATVAPRAG